MDAHLAKIAKSLPRWEVVAKLLGLESQMVKDIEDRYRDESEDQRLEALMKWIGKEGPQATYGKLYDVLREMGEGEVAEKVKELMRGNLKRAFCANWKIMFCTHVNNHPSRLIYKQKNQQAIFH